MMAFDPKESFGANVGNNPGDQTIGPGQSKTYTYYAHPEYGELAALIQDWGNVVENPRNGLFGSIIIGPKGSSYRDPVTGADITLKSSWRADVLVDRTISGNENRKNYRDFSLMFQDEDNIVGVSFMPYIQQVAGITAVNYRSEPTAWRMEKGCEVSEIFSCVKAGAVPATPLLQAHVGDPVANHVLGARTRAALTKESIGAEKEKRDKGVKAKSSRESNAGKLDTSNWETAAQWLSRKKWVGYIAVFILVMGLLFLAVLVGHRKKEEGHHKRDGHPSSHQRDH